MAVRLYLQQILQEAQYTEFLLTTYCKNFEQKPGLLDAANMSALIRAFQETWKWHNIYDHAVPDKVKTKNKSIFLDITSLKKIAFYLT